MLKTNNWFASSCIAALCGAQTILTDLPDRLRLLKKNVEANINSNDILGSASVCELTWGEDLDPQMLDLLPDYGNQFILLASILINCPLG